MLEKNDYRHSEEILKVIQEQTIMGINIIQDNKIVYMNKVYEDISGYSFDEIKDWDITQIMTPVHPDDRDFVRAQALKKQRGDPDAVINYQFRTITKSGDVKWIDLYSKTIIYKGRSADLLTFIDITDKKEAQKTVKEAANRYELMRAQFKTLLESTTDLVLVIDNKLTIILINKNVENYLSKTSNQLIRKKIVELYPTLIETTFYNALKRALETGISENVVDHVIRADGFKYFFDVRMYPINEGILCIARDVTKEKEYEQKLLDSEEKYREAYKLVNFFNNLFAHDMSNILQSIKSSIGYYGLFREDLEKMKEFGDVVEIIKKHADRGKTLIDNVRKLSHLDDTTINIHPVNVSSILNKSIDHLKTGFQDRNIDIKINGLNNKIKVQANELLIDVFDNILNNAVKYTDPEEDVVISIFISQLYNDEDDIPMMIFEFKDYGIGITDAKKEILFKKLYSENLSERGMGMGLSLVKKIVEGYGGSIHVEDRIQGDHTKGSNFVVEFVGVEEE